MPTKAPKARPATAARPARAGRPPGRASGSVSLAARPVPAPTAAARSPGMSSPSRPAVSRVSVDEASEGQRLDNFLLKTLKGVPKTHVYRIIRSGEVRVNGGRAQADQRLALHDEVRLPPVSRPATPADKAVPARDFTVLFEDEVLLAIDKPAGVAVHGGSGVDFGVIEQLRRARPQARFLELVHRLDKETSGVLLVAKRRSALTALQDQMRRRETGKVYLALVQGEWPDSRKVIDVALHKYLTPEGERRVRVSTAEEGRRSVTLVKVLRRWTGFSLLEVTIKTGRTHQIRVHLASAGCPIVGDDKYGDFALNKAVARSHAAGGWGLARMFLHARSLSFDHPVSGERITVDAPLPQDCDNALKWIP